MKQIILVATLLLATHAALADHHQPETEGAGGAAQMSEEDIMAAIAKTAELREPHARLAESVGRYDAEMVSYMDPGGEPTTSTMTVERYMDLEGRVLVEDWQGEVMGSPFQGQARTGYDNVTERYWTTWTDNWSTGVMVMYGDWDKEQDALVFTGEAVHPMTRQTYSMRSVGRYPAPGKETMEMYEDLGEGEYKSMSFTLTRR